EQAHDLVLELRQRFKLEAFVFKQVFDFSKPTEGLGYNRYGGARRMRYSTNNRFEEIGVLVGNFGSLEDAQLDKTLEQLKYLRPDTLDPNKKGTTSQRLMGLRSLYHMISKNPAEQNKGPMGSAFIT